MPRDEAAGRSAPLLVTVAVLAALWVTNAGKVAFFTGGPSADPSKPTGPRPEPAWPWRETAAPSERQDPFAGLSLFNFLGYLTLGLFTLALLAFVDQRHPEQPARSARSTRGGGPVTGRD